MSAANANLHTSHNNRPSSHSGPSRPKFHPPLESFHSHSYGRKDSSQSITSTVTASTERVENLESIAAAASSKRVSWAMDCNDLDEILQDDDDEESINVQTATQREVPLPSSLSNRSALLELSLANKPCGSSPSNALLSNASSSFSNIATNELIHGRAPCAPDVAPNETIEGETTMNYCIASNSENQSLNRFARCSPQEVSTTALPSCSAPAPSSLAPGAVESYRT